MENRGISRTRAVFGYGAALALTPYVLIKIVWAGGTLLGLVPRDEGVGVAGMVLLNTVTVGLGLAGIALALALVRPWGERIPAFPVLLFSWVGGGFLIPMIPYAVVSSGTSGGGTSVMPAWEFVAIQGSFLGMAVGLAGALPLYLRARWPAAFAGRVDGRTPKSWSSTAKVALAGTVLVGIADLYWVAGGTAGLAHPGARDLDWRLQTGNAALWSLTGAWCVWVIARGRSSVRLWIPVGLLWLVSGFHFAWSAWKLPFVVLQMAGVDIDAQWPEQLGIVTAQFVLGVVTGLAMLMLVVREQRARA
ncbi:hypothetical protein [Actinoplanes sp. HUAS TT8]|uniref:hypothetical protein n=1 Tax=Actinoplanes sp. HUAS TT8 TaxID=3447453 RepID=UPI003F51AF76